MAKITVDQLLDAVERRDSSLDNPGFCIACGIEVEGCDPDSRELECHECGEKTVYGAEEILIGIVG